VQATELADFDESDTSQLRALEADLAMLLAVNNLTREAPDMPLAGARTGRRIVIGGPVTRTVAVVGTAAIVKHGRDRREDLPAGNLPPRLGRTVLPETCRVS
jgi:hypothetical protein